MNGLIGRKLGMTRLFDEEGTHVPVTVIEAGPCPVVQVMATAVQLGFGAKKPKRSPKALLGHVKRAGLETAPRVLHTFPVTAAAEGAAVEAPKPGEAVTVAIFKTGDRVKVTGVTKGRGFQGVVHRHHFGGGPETHGNTRHRKPGSIAPGTDPSRIIKGKRMPGHMGARRFTELGLRVVRVDVEQNLLFVRAAPARLPPRDPEEDPSAREEVGAQRPGPRGGAAGRGSACVREAEDQDAGRVAREPGARGPEGAGADGGRRAGAQRVSLGPQPSRRPRDAVRRRDGVRDPVVGRRGGRAARAGRGRGGRAGRGGRGDRGGAIGGRRWLTLTGRSWRRWSPRSRRRRTRRARSTRSGWTRARASRRSRRRSSRCSKSP